ncbi:MAG: hypothetical protein AABX25_00020 [Nanoarchaeota archaeon]
MSTIKERAIKWYQDKKLIIAFILIIISFILGFYSKAIIITEFYKPISLITGLSLYTFSWILLFIGVFMVGWRAVKAMHVRIHHHVRKTVKNTYHHARKFPKRATDYTKNIHKKGFNKIVTSSKAIAKRIKQND